MKIYTKMGDDGYTSRPGGQRVRKYDPRTDAVGVVDELNAQIGWCLHACAGQQHLEARESLGPLQSELFAVGALLSTAGTECCSNVRLDESAIARIEGQIDAAWGKLPELTGFVAPGGCELACRLHLARTVCRRAERAVAAAAGVETRTPLIILRYLNRLSDLLFVMARLANHNEGVTDQPWGPGKPQ
jgi:cob(I)alamin adenosyltransferase